MRIITFALALFFLTLTNAVKASEDYYCDINAVQTKDFSNEINYYDQSNHEELFQEWLIKANAGDKKYQYYVGKAYFLGDGIPINKNKSFEWLKKSADQGYPMAQNNLAVIYGEGEIVAYNPIKAFKLFCQSSMGGFSTATLGIGYLSAFALQDIEKAIIWVTKAAEQGNSEAQNELGNGYLQGQYMPINYQLAYKWFSKSANQGNSDAQVQLGWMYDQGLGVEENPVLAAEWFYKSAIQDNSDGQYNLGVMYSGGRGVKKDLKKAFYWFNKSAIQGDYSAQYNLGLMFANGEGVDQDFASSFKWYKASAEQGFMLAQYNLALLYFHGKGTSKDLKLAVSWYKKAAEQGSSDAQNNLGWSYQFGKGVNKDYQLAVKWYKKSAEQGNELAQSSLGFMYQNGYGVTKNLKKAFEFYEKSANQGYADAQKNLGWMYFNVKDIQDYKLALSWYKKAAEQGNAEAQFSVGFIYSNGYGVPENYKLALSWYKKAAEQGNIRAQYNLGWMYFNINEIQDYKLAHSWYKKAANQGNAEAQHNLAVSYFNGYGVDQDYDLANSWYKKAANNGIVEAQFSLGVNYANGQGVLQDDKLAISWYKKAANQGYLDAQYNLGFMYVNGRGVSKSFDQGLDWFKKAALQGHVKAIQEVGKMLLNSQGLEPALEWFQMGIEAGNHDSAFTLGMQYSVIDSKHYDIQLAIKYLELAYELGDRDAPSMLGTIYNWRPNGGHAGLQDEIKKAEYWYLKSAKEFNDPYSQAFLANIYGQPSIWPEMHDENKSFYWAKKSADQGNLLGMDYLAKKYEWGFGTKQNGAMAIKILKDIVKKGDIGSSMNSLRYIGDIYAYGRAEIERDYIEAKKYYLKAEALGDKESQNLLGVINIALGDYKNAKKWFEKSATEESLESIMTIDKALAGDADAEYDLALMISMFDKRDEVNNLYESAALKGSIKAQSELGINYKSGIGVKENVQVSLYWLKKAAQQGNAMAQNNLGVAYHNGEGVVKDIDQAFYWYKMSSEQNYPLSFRNLGSIYATEFNDSKNAIKNFKLAIEYKDYSAAWDLAHLYKNGTAGVKVDKKLAFKWMLLGAEKFDKKAQLDVSIMYLDGEGIEANEDESTRWLVSAYNLPIYEEEPKWIHEEIKTELAYRYYWGIGVENSLEKAKEFDLGYALETLGKFAIEEKDDMTMLSIAIDYENIAENYKKAKYWYKKSAQIGNLEATKTLADIYRFDLDYKSAEFWYLRAISQNDIESMEDLAFIYSSEEESPGIMNTRYNPDKAFELLVRAKNEGSTTYHYDLSYLYKYGLGVDKDIKKSINLLKEMLNLPNLNRNDEELALVTMMWTFIANDIDDEKQISKAMTFLIDSAKQGSVKSQTRLAEIYLNQRFKYFDVAEGLYWLDQAKDKSFHANILLSERYFSLNYDFQKYGASLINAIDLYETGEDQSFITDRALINAYQDGANFYYQIGVPEKAELLLRKSSLYFLESDQNYYDLRRKILLAAVSSDYETSTLYLESLINESKTREDISAKEYIYAVNTLHDKYLQGREPRKALNLAVNSMKFLQKFPDLENYSKEMSLLASKDSIELGDYFNARFYFEKADLDNSMSTSDYVWSLIIDGVLEIKDGDSKEGFNKINSALKIVEDSNIPLRNYDLEIATIAMRLLNQDNKYDLSSVLMNKVVSFYRSGVDLRIQNNSVISPYEKNQIRDAISEYIYASSNSNLKLKDLGFEEMQLASGLTLSDTVIKSISSKELEGTEYIKSKLLETLNSERREMVEEKFKILGSNYLDLVKINNKLDDLDKQIASLEKDLKGVSVDTLSAFITPLDLVKENLSDGDGLIAMLVSSERSYVWLATKDGLYRNESELTLSEVSEYSSNLLTALNPSNINNSAFPIVSSSALYDLLINPFETELKGIDRLIFSPDPSLSQIPFSILTKSGEKSLDIVNTDEDLRGISKVKNKSINKAYNSPFSDVDWLIKDYAIAIIPSVYSYVGLEAVAREEGGSFDSFIGIGNPLLSGTEVVLRSNEKFALNDQRGAISRTLQDLSALPETESELNTIAKFFNESNVITQENATETSVRDMDLSEANVIAFATHALVSNEIDNLFEPAIVLTPVDSDNPENDGLLLASEVSELNLNADIVLLSACNTASSFDESNSQGLSGLADSFFEAGAKSLLASYWSVISDSAVDITTRMFERTNTGKTYSHKHRESVLEILNEPNSFKSNPVYWAPFMVVGVN